MNGDEDGEIDRRLGNAHAADRVDENIEAARFDAAVTVQHREQQREPLRIEADGKTAGHRALDGIDERLNLDQQRTRAFERRDNRRSRHRLGMMRQEDRRRIGDAFQTPLGHGEDAELIRRAETILDRADETKARMRIAFEVEHRIDDVLENARARDRAFLRDVADENHDDAALLGKPRQLRRAFANLRDAAGRRGQRVGIRRLNRVDDDDFGR